MDDDDPLASSQLMRKKTRSSIQYDTSYNPEHEISEWNAKIKKKLEGKGFSISNVIYAHVLLNVVFGVCGRTVDSVDLALFMEEHESELVEACRVAWESGNFLALMQIGMPQCMLVLYEQMLTSPRGFHTRLRQCGEWYVADGSSRFETLLTLILADSKCRTFHVCRALLKSPLAQMKKIAAGWDSRYIGKYAELFVDAIREMSEKARTTGGKVYTNHVEVIQSSGSGKSRMMTDSLTS